MRCAFYCTADHYRLGDLALYLADQGFSPKMHEGALQIEVKAIDKNYAAEAFFFPYGAVVFWGFEEKQEEELLKEIKSFEVSPVKDLASDVCSYIWAEDGSSIINDDEIRLVPGDPLIQLSYSYALSQSVKLSVFEDSIYNTIERAKDIPNVLVEKGKIPLSQKKLSQQIGELVLGRNYINLQSDVLDKPEFFWKRPSYEPYYLAMAQYMEISNRLDVLNRRLDVVHELYNILSNELKHHHSSRLEWIIIILILIEVVLAISRDVLHWF